MNRTALLLTALALATSATQAQTIISAPRAFPIVIDQPGHYRLGSTLNVPAGAVGIKILAANVVLDLNGFTLKGPVFCGTYCPAAGQASGVTVHAGNVTVRNGGIVGFDQAGVQLANHSAVLEDLTLSDNYHAGIYRTSMPANPKPDIMPVVVRRVMAVRNGIAGIYGYGMTIENSQLAQNYGSGLFTQGYNRLFENSLSHNKLYGYQHVIGVVAPPDAMRANHFQATASSPRPSSCRTPWVATWPMAWCSEGPAAVDCSAHSNSAFGCAAFFSGGAIPTLTPVGIQNNNGAGQESS